MKGIFVTGTDTGVGKTVVTGCLARSLLESGYSVITQKWIETGCRGNFSEDIREHLRIMGRGRSDIKDYLKQVCPYRFKKACSPHLAAKLEHRKIDPDKIIRSFKILSEKFDFVVVEGTGGALVPFNPPPEIPGLSLDFARDGSRDGEPFDALRLLMANGELVEPKAGDERGFGQRGREPRPSGRGRSAEKRLIIDIAKDLDLPVLVVARNKLGAINHTLLTIEALRARKMKILGIIFNNINKEDKHVLKDNPRIIKALTKEKVFENGFLAEKGF